MEKVVINKLDFLKKVKNNSFIWISVPWLFYALYLIFVASPQYESESLLIVKSTDPNNNFDPSSLLLSTVSSASTTSDSQLIEAFIKSRDMLNYLNSELNLESHYSTKEADIFSRLTSEPSAEQFVEFYLSHISVEVDSTTSVISLTTRAFTPEFAHMINTKIVQHAENFINTIGNNLAKSKLTFAQGEHDVVESKLRTAKENIIEFQSKYNVLDPTAEGAAFQQIGFSLEATLAQKEAELSSLSTTMSDMAPEVQNIKREIAALHKQINMQKNRINSSNIANSSLSVSELMAQFSNLQVQLQLAVQAFSSSLITLESARVEAYQQLQHLVTIQSPTTPEDNQYPDVIYNLTLFGVILFALYGTVRIIIATIREL